ncbi:MAG: hypothetical protein FWD47_11310 [Treponema sp.]|nr:hypothetical protein [Treponema sp.]
MKFFNEKWENSSLLTKVSAWIMAFVTLLFLVSVFIIMSWSSKLGGGLGGFVFLYLIIFALFGLITFGLFKVNRIARGLMIWACISYLIGVIISFSVVGYIMDYAKAATQQAVVEAVGEDAIRAAENAGAIADDAADNAAASALASQAASQVQASGITGIIVKAIIKAIPVNVLASIGFYLFVFLSPMYLIVLSGLLLIFCGKDFKKIKKAEA